MLLREILPEHVASWETAEDRPDAALFPEEELLVQGAVETRRREFSTGRYCARKALEQLGHSEPQPVLRGARGTALWPPAVRGSITHCSGYRAAAVARMCEVAAVGIDAEPNVPLSPEVLRMVALPPERELTCRLLAEASAVRWDKLLFSAKESVYKVWYPLTGLPLNFTDAQLGFDPESGTFAARLLPHVPRVPGVPRELTGRWAVRGDLIVTAITLPAPGAAGRPGARATASSRRPGELPVAKVRTPLVTPR
ncbi:4'-phosphopantetheinyl transferase superfamily protein [Streptomyces sp. 891-h]|uniref:4'-phosphopantetheinyl transferase family protein n=1 Tax=Streptomyces sp. 891-h TaxID=2720714 RepID=UPI001FA9662D|nr:4'-phosphopantetheinyl transferase superfamily protein [Streptomyces sp. 891-h]